jgi:hypothetical protein
MPISDSTAKANSSVAHHLNYFAYRIRTNIISNAHLIQDSAEFHAVASGQSAEDQEEVSIPEEGARLDVEEAYKVLQLDEALPFQVDFLRVEAFCR